MKLENHPSFSVVCTGVGRCHICFFLGIPRLAKLTNETRREQSQRLSSKTHKKLSELWATKDTDQGPQGNPSPDLSTCETNARRTQQKTMNYQSPYAEQTVHIVACFGIGIAQQTYCTAQESQSTHSTFWRHLKAILYLTICPQPKTCQRPILLNECTFSILQSRTGSKGQRRIKQDKHDCNQCSR